MQKKYGILLVTGLFYMGMLLLTIGSKRAYLASLTPVTVMVPGTVGRMVDGVLVLGVSVPGEMLEKPFFLMERTEINGELRLIARELTGIEAVVEKDGTAFLTDARISSMSLLVWEGAENLYDGKEVRVQNEEDLPSWWK